MWGELGPDRLAAGMRARATPPTHVHAEHAKGEWLSSVRGGVAPTITPLNFVLDLLKINRLT